MASPEQGGAIIPGTLDVHAERDITYPNYAQLVYVAGKMGARLTAELDFDAIDFPPLYAAHGGRILSGFDHFEEFNRVTKFTTNAGLGRLFISRVDPENTIRYLSHSKSAISSMDQLLGELQPQFYPYGNSSVARAAIDVAPYTSEHSLANIAPTQRNIPTLFAREQMLVMDGLMRKDFPESDSVGDLFLFGICHAIKQQLKK